MSRQNYSLDIISHHPNFINKSLRQYYVDGINTVGAWGDEPFEVVFKNHTSQKVQVKLTIDGTDVLTGAPGTTDITKEMWVVNGYSTLSLKAWPETNNGGAQLVFTSGSNSVAVHTHGDLSNRGIIAAAVYVESHVERIKSAPPVIYRDRYYPSYPTWYGSDYYFSDTVITCNNTFGGSESISLNSADYSRGLNDSDSLGNEKHKGLEKLVAVGAGQHVDQKINYVSGLIKPMFTETVRVKYMWWDDLVSKLRTHHVPAPHESGFPADQKKTNINLGSTPRIGSFQRSEHAASPPVYLRV